MAYHISPVSGRLYPNFFILVLSYCGVNTSGSLSSIGGWLLLLLLLPSFASSLSPDC